MKYFFLELVMKDAAAFKELENCETTHNVDLKKRLEQLKNINERDRQKFET